MSAVSVSYIGKGGVCRGRGCVVRSFCWDSVAEVTRGGYFELTRRIAAHLGVEFYRGENMFGSTMPISRAKALPLLLRLPVEVRHMVTDQLTLSDLVALGQTNSALRAWVQRAELLTPQIWGERGAMGRFVANCSNEGPWARGVRQASWLTYLQKNGLMLPMLQGGERTTLSQSGRFVATHLPNDDIVAYDILSPKKPFHLLARYAGTVRSIQFWDDVGFLWALSAAEAKLWKVGSPHEPAACISLGEGAVRAEVGDFGQLLMVMDRGQLKVTWYRASDLVVGNRKPAGQQSSVIDATVASRASHLAVLHRGLLSSESPPFCFDDDSDDEGEGGDSRAEAQNTRPTPQFLRKATLEVRNLVQGKVAFQGGLSWGPYNNSSLLDACVWLSPDGSRAAMAPHYGALATLAVDGAMQERPLLISGLCGCGISELTMSPNGQFLSYIGAEDDIQLFDLRDRKSPLLFEQSAGSIFWLHQFSADGTVWWKNDEVVEFDFEVSSDQIEPSENADIEDEQNLSGELTKSISTRVDEENEQQFSDGISVDTEIMFVNADGRFLSAKGEAIDPSGKWAVLSGGGNIFLMALGMSHAYRAQLLRKLFTQATSLRSSSV